MWARQLCSHATQFDTVRLCHTGTGVRRPQLGCQGLYDMPARTQTSTSWWMGAMVKPLLKDANYLHSQTSSILENDQKIKHSYARIPFHLYTAENADAHNDGLPEEL
ncbi:hypothetical protein V5799_025099 [Amblyomma americanum]|uniref:Uncharacterized protein n=1 Tax=Amblyomma americanum TaxID=6943 RepID=A0AAQ4EA60_AMBAM